jgi:hypothetical protein
MQPGSPLTWFTSSAPQFQLPAGARLAADTDPRERLLLELDEELRQFGLNLPREKQAALNVIRARVYSRYQELTGRCYCRIGLEVIE